MPTKAVNLDPLYAAVGMYLRGVRLSKEMTQRQISDRLGVTPTAITYYERGMSRVPLSQYLTWCRFLGLDPGETLNLVDETMARHR